MPNPILIQTKLHRPRLPKGLIIRPQLMEILDQGFDAGITLVSAAAGFGKSTLVSSWVEEVSAGRRDRVSPIPSAWITLDPNDSDLIDFIQYFIGALRTVFKNACPETTNLLNFYFEPPPEVISATLINEIDQYQDDFILVLDDYYTIHGEAVHTLINEILLRRPINFHLIIITRRNPPFPLPSLRAKGQIVEVRSLDLRFTEEEVDRYLRLTLPEPVTMTTVQMIQERTEGWIAGIQLTILSLRSAKDSEAILSKLALADTDITSYLVDEVLSHQPEAVQIFLKRTSILEHFWAGLCESLFAGFDPEWTVQDCLDWIERANLFVISLTDRKGYYRYHKIFREMLQQKLLSEIGSEDVKRIHCQAAMWFSEQGMIEEAIHHAVHAGDIDLVSSMMEGALCEALNREDRLVLERWLNILPQECVEQRPGLMMIKTWVFEFRWQLGAVMKNIQKIESLLETNGTANTVNRKTNNQKDLHNIFGQILLLRAQAMYHNNQMEQCIAYSQQALESLSAEWKYVRGGAVLYLGLGSQAAGKAETVERYLLEQYELQSDKTDNFALRLLFSLCFVYFLSGRLEQTIHIAEGMLYQSAHSQLTVIEGWAHYFLGRVYYQWNNLELAMRHFQKLCDIRYSIPLVAAREGMACLAVLQLINNQSAEAWQTFSLVSALDLGRIGIETPETQALRARLFFLQGDIRSACHWADGYSAVPVDQPLTWENEIQVTKAHILLTRGGQADLETGLQILDALERIARATCNISKIIAIQGLRAVALDALGKTHAAQEALSEAIDLSRSGGYIRSFIDLGAPMQRLLAEFSKRKIFLEPVNRLLAAFRGDTQAVEQMRNRTIISGTPTRGQIYFDEPYEHLTARELEILELMQEPLSAKQIAQRLSISHLTVKRHMINIYSKLGVNRRWDAIEHARRLGILRSTF